VCVHGLGLGSQVVAVADRYSTLRRLEMKTTCSTRGAFVRACTSATLLGALAVPFCIGAAPGELLPGAPSAPIANQQISSSTTNAESSPADVLGRIVKSASQVYEDLTNFVCREDIERYKGSSHNPTGRKLDVITSTVSYDRDAEHYTDIYQNNKPLNRIRGLSGAWSEGEYGTLLGETLKALKSRKASSISHSTLDGAPAAVYSFDYSSDDSPWEIEVTGHHYSLPFRGQVWASPTTGDVLRVDRIATDVPQQTGIAGVNWSVSFGSQTADKRTFWLPTKAVYSVSYLEGARHEWNLIAFSGYRRYGSDVVVRFE